MFIALSRVGLSGVLINEPWLQAGWVQSSLRERMRKGGWVSLAGIAQGHTLWSSAILTRGLNLSSTVCQPCSPGQFIYRL